VLYDGGCGFCRKWVPYWAGTLARRGFAIAPLQAAWVAEALALDRAELERDLRILLASGEQVVGADAYRHVLRRTWWAWPLFALASLPGLRRLFDAAYRGFADHRHRFSRACGLSVDEPGPG
jgi:predicted DCC family thiol-disulfide oxidoreductase YuxK